MKNRNIALKIAAVLSAVLLTLGGCKAKDVFSSGIKGEKEYYKGIVAPRTPDDTSVQPINGYGRRQTGTKNPPVRQSLPNRGKG